MNTSSNPTWDEPIIEARKRAVARETGNTGDRSTGHGVIPHTWLDGEFIRWRCENGHVFSFSQTQDDEEDERRAACSCGGDCRITYPDDQPGPWVDPEKRRPTHVDEWIDDHSNDPYARFVLHLFRLPAFWQVDFAPFVHIYTLYCDHDGKRYRVTGASVGGDVMLQSKLTKDHGYDVGVSVDACSNWGNQP